MVGSVRLSGSCWFWFARFVFRESLKNLCHSLLRRCDVMGRGNDGVASVVEETDHSSLSDTEVSCGIVVVVGSPVMGSRVKV